MGGIGVVRTLLWFIVIYCGLLTLLYLFCLHNLFSHSYSLVLARSRSRLFGKCCVWRVSGGIVDGRVLVYPCPSPLIQKYTHWDLPFYAHQKPAGCQVGGSRWSSVVRETSEWPQSPYTAYLAHHHAPVWLIVSHRQGQTGSKVPPKGSV